MDARRPSTPVEIVGQREATLQSAQRVGNRLILSYLGDASSQAEIVDLSGNRVSQLTLGAIGTAAGFDGSAQSSETFYAFTSYNRPTTIYRLDTATNQTTVFAAPAVSFDPNDYSIEQRFFPSRDGTQIPMFVVMKRGAGPERRFPHHPVWLWRICQPADTGVQPDAAGLAGRRRGLCGRQSARGQRIWHGVA